MHAVNYELLSAGVNNFICLAAQTVDFPLQLAWVDLFLMVSCILSLSPCIVDAWLTGGGRESGTSVMLVSVVCACMHAWSLYMYPCVPSIHFLKDEIVN